MTTAELLFRNALVVDGTGSPARMADVAIAGGLIVAVGENLPGAADETIDADGLALAPGFIDVHTHDDQAVLSPDGARPKISQGVTTVVVGNCGISLAPTPLARHAAPVPPLDLLGDAEVFRFTAFGDYLGALASASPVVNVAPLVGHTVLRARAMDRLDRPATEAEVAAMRADLADALDAGAIGLSTGLAYPPAKSATTDEVVSLVSVAAGHGGLWTTHMRDERTGVVAAVAETIDVARRTGARTLISHHKCCGEAAFGLSRTTLAMIDEARRTLAIDLDVYPYTASSTVLIETFARDSRRVTVSWSEPHPEMAGRDLADIASDWGVDTSTALERLKPGGAIYHQMDEADLDRILAFPPSLVGSDGLPRDLRPHPRLWGTFPRVVGHFARERGVIDHETAIAKMTGQTASVLGLKDRGRIAPGCRADLVLYDPGRIRDEATYDEPTRPAAGINRVYVNGRPVWSEGSATGARPGTVLARRAA
jgi:N-acyl-D-aspartate/D-glutamate deacylase